MPSEHAHGDLMARKRVDVAVILPDASPVITMARINRLDLFETFSAPIRIVDQVHYEITKPANDPDEKIGAWLERMGNCIEIVETLVGFGFRTKLERGETPKSGNLGEIAVDEYATQLALSASPTFVPLVLFEDPDVLETRIARLPRVHLLNTAAWLRALADEGIIPDAAKVLDDINAGRKSPMIPIERPGRTSRIQSRWLRRPKNDAG